MRNAAVLRLALILTALACPVRAADWAGTAQSVDGQTLVINGHRLRLSRIQAIGNKLACTDVRHNIYPCGWMATWHLTKLISFKQVACSDDAQDENSVPLVRCMVGNPNLNREMVRAGSTTSDEYRAEQDLAKQEKVGMWLGSTH